MWPDLMAISFFVGRCDEAMCFSGIGNSCDHCGH